MTRKICAAVAAALLVSTATPSFAGGSHQLLARSGQFEAWYIIRDDDHQQICGINMQVDSGSSVYIKHSREYILVDVYKVGWEIPDGTNIPVTIGFDGRDPWKWSYSYGSKSKTGDGRISLVIQPDAMQAQFVSDLSVASDNIVLKFPTGNEPAWLVRPYYGLKEVLPAYKTCLTAIYAKS